MASGTRLLAGGQSVSALRQLHSVQGVSNRLARGRAGRTFSSSCKRCKAVYLSRSFVPRLSPAQLGSFDGSAGSSSSNAPAPGSAEDALSNLLQGGYIRQSSAGVYTFLPLGLRVLQRITSIIEEEMEGIECARLEMPTILSQKLWQKSGRDKDMGSELYRLNDRKGSTWVLAPTHEEEVTKLVGSEIQSYKQLPVRVYQITRKHRDEPRPRLGLLRTREFMMKDAYTFDSSIEAAQESYRQMQRAYHRVMNRLFGQGGWRMAAASSGAMGGDLSHEYHVEDPAGEDIILACSSCSYSANSELFPDCTTTAAPPRPPAPTIVSEEDVSVFLFANGNHPFAAGALKAVIVPRGQQPSFEALEVASRSSSTSEAAPPVDPLLQLHPSPAGATTWDWKDRPEGPIVRYDSLHILADESLSTLAVEDLLSAVEWSIASYGQMTDQGPDAPMLSDFFPSVAQGELDLSYHPLIGHTKSNNLDTQSPAAPTCPSCNTPLTSRKSIEVGHTFYLGTKYSKALGQQFAGPPSLGEGKQERLHFEMGCFGLGVTRLMGVLAIGARKRFLLEQVGEGQDQKPSKKKTQGPEPGLRWDPAVVPFEHSILLPPYRDDDPTTPAGLPPQFQASVDEMIQEIQEQQQKEQDILVDDRPGVSLAVKVREANLRGGRVCILRPEGSERSKRR